MPAPYLVIQNLSKRFGSSADGVAVVRNVNISVGSGEIYALVGPNGAGKTTLLKMVVGLLKPDSGSVRICGHDSMENPRESKNHFGYVPDEPSGYDFLSGMEFLVFTGKLRGMDSDAIGARIRHLETLFPLADALARPMSEYSRGVKQKVLILAALMTAPEILIIDEPIVGLDPASIGSLGNLFTAYAAGGHAVVFVTHILEFALKYATRAGVMKAGALMRDIPINKSTKSGALQ
jgi:ABC-2 type transport system ATP-binding protein